MELRASKSNLWVHLWLEKSMKSFLVEGKNLVKEETNPRYTVVGHYVLRKVMPMTEFKSIFILDYKWDESLSDLHKYTFLYTNVHSVYIVRLLRKWLIWTGVKVLIDSVMVGFNYQLDRA